MQELPFDWQLKYLVGLSQDLSIEKPAKLLMQFLLHFPFYDKQLHPICKKKNNIKIRKKKQEEEDEETGRKYHSRK
jgi:hypothetical protein